MVTKSEVDWEGWTPGNPEAAAKLIGTIDAPGLKNLLDGANVTINGIQQTRYDELAGILARSVGSGLGVDETAKMIDEYFSKGMDWAEVVARTETARAVTAGTLDSYAEGGVEQVEWLTADGGCEICGEYEDMGPVGIDEGFDDVEGPPAHPNCLCTLLPSLPDDYVPPAAEETEEAADETETQAMPYELSPVFNDKETISFDEANALFPNGDFQNKLEQRFNEIAKNEVIVYVPDTRLSGVVEDQRIKNAFEVSFRNPEYLSTRKSVERDFGVPDNARDSDRPVYGAIGNYQWAENYGDFGFVLKDSVKERTTMSVGDTFRSQTPVSVSDVISGNASSENMTRSIPRETITNLTNEPNRPIGEYGYWEAQIHGGVSMSDVQEVRINPRHEVTPEEKVLLNKLKEAGVNVV